MFLITTLEGVTDVDETARQLAEQYAPAIVAPVEYDALGRKQVRDAVSSMITREDK